MIWHIKILHNLTSHDSIWHNVMILVSIQQHNMIWHIKILHNAQVSQSLEQKSDSFTDKSFRAHTRRTMHTTIGEGDETRPHICHIYHRLYLWRKFCHVEKFQISVKNLNNLWSFIEIYAVFVLNFCGEKSLWRKNDKYKVCTLLPPAWLRLNSILAAKNSCCSLPGSETCSPYQQWEDTFNLILFLLVFSKACSQLMSVFVSSPQQSYCTQTKRYESQETGRTLSGFWNRRQSSWATNYCIGR